MRRNFNSGDVQQILSNARQASANLNAFSTQLSSAASGVPGLMARTDTTIASFGRTANTLNTTIAGAAARAGAGGADRSRRRGRP